MSNIIRFHTTSQVEKKIIQTKKIENKKLSMKEPEIDPVLQKQQLLENIQALEAQYREIQQQLIDEKDSAQREIEQWWTRKQEEALQQSERLAVEASSKGFQEGYEQGTLRVEEEFLCKRQEMQELIDTAYDEKARIIQEAEPFLLSLSIKIAEKVIKEELKQHTEQLLNMVRDSLKQIEESDNVVMQVAPEDYPIILPYLEELRNYVDSEFKLVPVSNLTRGGCMIHTGGGSYDVTVDSQLQEIKKHLLAYFEENTNHEP